MDDEFGDVGQPVAHRHQRQAAREVGESHREYRDLLELPQGFDLPLRIVRRQPLGAGGEFAGKSSARRHLVERFGIDQFVEQQRKIRDLSRQEPADGADLDQPIEGRRLLLEQRQIGRAGADRIEHAQHPLHDDGGCGWPRRSRLQQAIEDDVQAPAPGLIESAIRSRWR